MTAMKNIQHRAKAQARPCRALLLCLFSVGAALSASPAQTGSISGTVNVAGTTTPLSGVRIVVVDRKAEKVIAKKPVENGHYEIAVPPGSYEVFACDPKLEYQPDSRQAAVKSGSLKTKDIRLSKKPLTVPAQDDEGRAIGPNVLVCLTHLESACEAEARTDAKGEIVIPGPESHFEVRERGGRPCE